MAEQEPRTAQEQAAQQPGGDDGDVFFVAMNYRGGSYSIPVQAEDPVASIFDFAQEALDFPRENCKLIHRGKMLRPDHDSLSIAEAGLSSGSKLMLVATSAHDVALVQSSRADPLVKGFAEEERDEANRRKRARAAAQSAWGTKQDSEYRFNSIKAEFKYSEPPPYEAEKLLQKLSTDPGIIDIMKARKFKVGILTEMSPVEAQERMAKRGTPNMDLLGYNQNAGEMIVLRLRTDSLKGFRPYHDLINTLIHELTHNVWGPHDNNFWQLYGELKAQYMRFHRFWSHSGHAADSNATAQFQGFAGDDEEGQAGGSGGFGQVLGSGEGDAARGSAQSRAAAAAEARSRQAAAKDAEARMREASEAAAAEAAAEEAEGVSSWTMGLPNFVSGDGKWVFACPCGQVHEFSGMCDAGAAAAAAVQSGGSAPSDAAAAGSSAVGGAPVGPPEAPPAEAAAPAEAPPAADAAAPMQVEEEAVGADAVSAQAPAVAAPLGETSAPAASAAPAAAAPPSPESVADVVMGEPSPAEPVQEEPESALPALDLAELSELGLDSAALWLHRFEDQLRALLGSPPGRPHGREAVSLLLRLVRNVVESPNDQKFRRIRADNPRVRSSLLSAGAEAEALMTLLGFEDVTESGERVFLLRDAVFDCVRLRMGQELLERELHSTATSVQ